MDIRTKDQIHFSHWLCQNPSMNAYKGSFNYNYEHKNRPTFITKCLLKAQ